MPVDDEPSNRVPRDARANAAVGTRKRRWSVLADRVRQVASRLATAHRRRPFNLLRSFAIAGFLSVAAVSAMLAWLISDFVAGRMLARDAAVTTQFVQSTLETMPGRLSYGPPGRVPLDYAAYFDVDPKAPLAPEFEAYFLRLAEMPDVVRAQAYAPDGMRIWSTNPKMVGIRNVSTNLELRGAIEGKVANHFTPVIWGITKNERKRLHPSTEQFEEIYFPIWDRSRTEVVGAVELYKMSDELYLAIRDSVRVVAGAMVAGGVLLYLALYWIVRRAARLIERQRAELLAAERLASVGEMAAAVAHNIRNPLAAIRSTCDVMLELGPPAAHADANGVLEEVARAEGALRGLMQYAEMSGETPEAVNVAGVIGALLEEHRGAIVEQGVQVHFDAPAPPVTLRASRALLHEVFEIVLSNAVEAMPDGGTLAIRATAERTSGTARIEIADSGVGIPPELAERVFRPFFTTKGRGLGLGLAYARRIVERHGGRIDLTSVRPGGTTVAVEWPVDKHHERVEMGCGDDAGTRNP